MSKRLNGIVLRTDMKDTVIVEVTRKTAHPMYKKVLKRTKTFKADTKEVQASVGDEVSIIETRPISKDKHFKIEKVLVEGKRSIKTSTPEASKEIEKEDSK